MLNGGCLPILGVQGILMGRGLAAFWVLKPLIVQDVLDAPTNSYFNMTQAFLRSMLSSQQELTHS